MDIETSATAQHVSFATTSHFDHEYPHSRGVHQLFEAKVASMPTAVAAINGEFSVDYEELNRRSNRVAHHLLAAGLTRRPVAIWMDRSISCLIALLGTLKAGAAFVPIDVSLPSRRMCYILRDSAAGCVLVDGASRATLYALDIATPQIIDVEDAKLELLPGHNPDCECDPQGEAYMMYTSGSTGEPKGVVVHHEGLTNYVWWASKQFVSANANTFALYSSLSFDLTVTSIFVPLICGGSIVVYPEMQNDAPPVVNVVTDNRVDVLKLTPAHLALIRDCDLSASRLKVLILGGEDLKAEHALDLHRKLGGRAAIYNEYGPTETVVACTAYRFNPQRDTRGSVPIGAPIDNMEIHVLDEQLRAVPQGCVGEIYIGGTQVALGYHNKPEITSRHFLPSPLDPRVRWYRSGDMGRRNERGELVFLGRKDSQIKLRGYRIELGEIESTLLSFPGIDECTVVSTKTTQREQDTSLRFCVRCGIASNYPNTSYSSEGVCNHCVAFDRYKSVLDDYFSDMDEFTAIVREMQVGSRGKYDCVVAFSGGKDSTYALCRTVIMGARVLAFTLDNGYISNNAKENIDRVISQLGIEHRYLRTDYMNDIFADSLRRYSNVCNGCFKTIYTLAINLAQEVGVDFIVMGLSRGQLLETRLGELLRSERFNKVAFEKNLIDARKIYHRVDDAVSRHLDTRCVSDDRILEKLRFVDFYRYCNVGRREMYDYIRSRVGWERPIDTGRSTNCLINDVGIYVHNKERRHHNYSLAYSWDVRLGHIARDEALRELDDSNDIDTERVHAIMAEIGYNLDDRVIEAGEAVLAAYYVAAQEIPDEPLRAHLATALPEYMVPRSFVRLSQLPLTPNGKVNREALPKLEARKSGQTAGGAPCNEVERQLVELWKEVLSIDGVGVHDDFFKLGGYSLSALMLLYRIDGQFHKTISIQEFSRAPTISQLAGRLSSTLDLQSGLPS